MPIGVGTAIVGASAIGAAGSIASGVMGSSAAKSAAQTQANADQQALATQTAAGNRAASALAPYSDVGLGAAHQIADLYGISYASQGNGLASTDANGVLTPANSNAAASSPGGAAVEQSALANFQNSPDYQFAFNQGLQALDRSAAAGGSLLSGGATKAAQQYGQGLASQQFSNYFSRLQSLASMGQNAAAGTASNSLSAANSQAQTQQGVGTALASGTVGSANAVTGALGGLSTAASSGVGSLSQYALQSQLLSKLGGTSPSSYTSSTGYSPSLALGNYGQGGIGSA